MGSSSESHILCESPLWGKDSRDGDIGVKTSKDEKNSAIGRGFQADVTKVSVFAGEGSLGLCLRNLEGLEGLEETEGR